jgi:hypothetical protein
VIVQRCDREDSPNWVWRQFLADTRCEQVEREIWDDNKQVYILDEISNSAGKISLHFISFISHSSDLIQMWK